MTYNEFKIKVYNIISKRLPPDTTVHLQRVYKNNGLVLDGLIFISANCAIAPTIYLNYYYENRDIFPSLDMIRKASICEILQITKPFGPALLCGL